MKHVLAVIVLIAICGVIGLGAEIHLPAAAPLSGTVLIAESFYQTVDDEQVPLPVAVWQNVNGMRTTAWFDTHIEAHPGDVIVIDPGHYKVDIWILSPGITVTTDPNADGIADISGGLEVDADNVILDHIAVTGPRKKENIPLCGHGIEVNRELLNTITIRNCLVEGNDWMGIHNWPSRYNQRDADRELRGEEQQGLWDRVPGNGEPDRERMHHYREQTGDPGRKQRSAH